MSTDLDALIAMMASVTGNAHWRRVRAAVSCEELQGLAALGKCLEHDPPQSGWLVGQSGHHLIVNGHLPGGRWLEGEWLARSGASYQLRDVAGSWVLAKVVEGEGEDCLVVDKQHRPDRGAPGALCWRVYHRPDGLQCQPVFAAFRGFAVDCEV